MILEHRESFWVPPSNLLDNKVAFLNAPSALLEDKVRRSLSDPLEYSRGQGGCFLLPSTNLLELSEEASRVHHPYCWRRGRLILELSPRFFWTTGRPFL
jgi:hypothetical protein